ncbi:hypothetical protein RRF57_010724 [Xylaria bambusicola]|uniref:Uncharacterized protein n=1 Tax=Xylaria bambusicola TaxID=326684 RepID=A0AAN7Z8W0_9PEZI
MVSGFVFRPSIYIWYKVRSALRRDCCRAMSPFKASSLNKRATAALGSGMLVETVALPVPTGVAAPDVGFGRLGSLLLTSAISLDNKVLIAFASPLGSEGELKWKR